MNDNYIIIGVQERMDNVVEIMIFSTVFNNFFMFNIIYSYV